MQTQIEMSRNNYFTDKTKQQSLKKKKLMFLFSALKNSERKILRQLETWVINSQATIKMEMRYQVFEQTHFKATTEKFITGSLSK